MRLRSPGILALCGLVAPGCGDDGGSGAGGRPAVDAGGGGGAEAPEEGDPCEPGQTAPCFAGTADQVDVGICRAGVRTCVDGALSVCAGQVLPAAAETCDGLDDDCDGRTDENLGEACKPCAGDFCHREGFGDGGDRPLVAGGESEGIRASEAGVGVALDATVVDVAFVWIANTDEGTVSKIDPRAGAEVARYLSALPLAGLPPAFEACDERGDGGGLCPSRTAVDLRGDVWVANRAFGGQGSVTKILAAGCPDKDEDGVVTTSRDDNGDGVIDVRDPTEFPGAADECLAVTVPIGSRNAKPRGLAVDPFNPEDHGSVWVGAYEDSQLVRVHGTTGQVLDRRDLPIRPYGAVMTAARRVWVTSLAGADDGIVPVDSDTGQVGGPVRIRSSTGCAGGYGIAADAHGRIWLGGWSCEAAFRYDPLADAWRTFPLGRGYTRGITVDGAGRVWVAHSHAGFPLEKVARVTRLDAETGGDRLEVTVDGAQETIGLGVDADGRIWAVNRGTNDAVRLDADTGAVLARVPTGPAPYTYSDFTGFGLRTFTARFGVWRGDVEACGQSGAPEWETLTWTADLPPGTRLAVWLRAAYRAEVLPSARRLGPFGEPPLDLRDVEDVAGRPLLRVEIELRTDDFDASPVLRGVQVQYRCPSG